MGPQCMAKALKELRIRFGSSTMVLSDLTIFGVAVVATVFAVEVEDVDRYQRKITIY